METKKSRDEDAVKRKRGRRQDGREKKEEEGEEENSAPETLIKHSDSILDRKATITGY